MVVVEKCIVILVIIERLNGLLLERKKVVGLFASSVERPCDNERSKEIE